MDFFDERILAALKDGKPRGFTALLCEVGFTHNTLQQHLDKLVARGLVVKEKNGFKQSGQIQIHLPCSIYSSKAGDRCTSKPV
jgi:predicted ArsR family transcriptional regulator